MDYRNAAGIAHDLGTAVNIVTMVFGNMGDTSATGVAMTRNRTTGEKEIEGDYLTNAQGEDVVAGIRITKDIAQLKEEMPSAEGIVTNRGGRTSHVNEIKIERELLEAKAQKVMQAQGIAVNYQFGTMIEIPRAALPADQLAEYAAFFSFGTNDLTQTTFGISRDDAEAGFLVQYMQRKIPTNNPFTTIDRDGVGELMKITVTRGRSKNPDLECGICGEHGGDPQSIAFCHELGLTYVSCSPFRIPVARLAAAHAAFQDHRGKGV